MLAALELKPSMGTAYGDLAAAANENKNYELVIKALDARAKFLPELPIGYFLRATAYDHLRQYKPAAENYHRFLETATGKLSRPGMAGSPSPDRDRTQEIDSPCASGYRFSCFWLVACRWPAYAPCSAEPHSGERREPRSADRPRRIRPPEDRPALYIEIARQKAEPPTSPITTATRKRARLRSRTW